MIETKQIPIWLTFATTVFLDINQTLRGRVSIAFDELQVVANHVKNTLDGYFEFSKSIPAPRTWPKSYEEMLREFREGVAETILKDVVFPLKSKYYKKVDGIAPGETARFYLLKGQPILCGMFAFRATLELHHGGVNLCNAYRTVTYPAQFYNALRQKENPVQPWPMMEEAIAIHTEARVFVGSAPKTVQESLRQICLVVGYSASAFAQNRRPNRPLPISKNGARGLKDDTVLGSFFRDDLEGRGGRVFSLQNVEKLLNEEAKTTELASDPKNKALRREWATTKHLTPLQLLEALTQFMPVELPKIDFNYFRMHQQSVELLRRLRVELDADLKKHFGPMYFKNESQLPSVGLYVIIAAFLSSKAAEELKLDGTGSKILEKAGNILEDFVKEQGN
ncbi:uncharacterized protein LY89DRAFT_124635 [Mollisia scopiformis]|uniref:Uncharacterized protein n=1 Tax=Mollisia scopiformis TaxID=149040 RepID=A0A194X3Y6_MOLSC|nr:uncharacterized protein LY89DRAFT_124635 [Mollisia scopiformis]KUJ14900.1 hypothetical protein LY89DRAFT_124635 [Mollisia scopiformis]